MPNFYHKQENVAQYKAMMAGYDNHTVLQALREVLPSGSTLLELGMGTGADLLALSQTYAVTGSDFSPLFVADFQTQHPDFTVFVLDASDLSLDTTFDCIYSNKVLQHLPAADFSRSLAQQAAHLNPNGILFLTLWYGTHREERYEDDLLFTYYTEEDLVPLLPPALAVERMERYTEAEPDDSLLVVLRKG